MIFRIDLNPETNGKKMPDKTPALLDRRAAWDGNTADWGSADVDGVMVTKAEVEALKEASKTKTVNISRAMKVKALLKKGNNPVAIFRALRKHGKGYGQSSIAHDCAALSKFG